EGFIGRERHPTDVAEAETDPATPAEAEPGDQRGRPIVMPAVHAGIPAPAAIPEPAAVVIRRPSPRIGADPSPAIPIFPDPTAMPIRRPAGIHRSGPPNVTVLGNIAPRAVGIEI